MDQLRRHLNSPMKHDSDLDQDGKTNVGEKWLDSAYILKLQLAESEE